MRLIDADAFIKKVVEYSHQSTKTIGMALDATPTVDAVSVVRCKNCKHWDGVPADETQDHECHLFDGNEEKIRIATPSDWFCPMGERRTDDERNN